MSLQKRKKIFKKVGEEKIKINHVCEVGVYLPHSSNILDFINEGIKTTLVEPDPASINAIREVFQDNKKLTLYPVAVFDFHGTVELSQKASSTFVSSLSASPALINENYQVLENEKFTVDCVKFNEIDDGTIDLLSVDTEGCEWYVLKYLISRPSIISLETHGKFYTNGFINEIKEWINLNGYKVWYKDGSDTVYVKEKLFEVSLKERIELLIQNIKIKLVKLKKPFRKFKRKKSSNKEGHG
jgi:FkbM family methyltransferase